MRTTVEMKPEHRAALLSLASRRGQKGFSAVLAEAIDFYLRSREDQGRRTELLLRLGGSISQKDADKMRRIADDLRQSWR
jgi:hypothetical protein